MYGRRDSSILPTPLAELSPDLLSIVPRPAGLWLPCDGPERKAYDLAGNQAKQVGSLNGGVTVRPSGYGALGAAWSTDGANNSGVVCPVAIPDASLTIQASLVVRALTNSIYNGYAMCGSQSFTLCDDGAHFKVFADIGGFATNFSGATAIQLGRRYEVSWVIAGGNHYLYVDGQLDGSGANGHGSCGPHSSISFLGLGGGAFPATNAECSLGAVWLSALSASQVAALRRSLVYGDPPLFAPRFAYLPDAAPTSTSGLLLARRRFAA